MELLVIVLVVGGSVVWVAYDAAARDWTGTGWSMGVWVILCLMIWVVFFPYYLLERRKVRHLEWTAVAPEVSRVLPPPGWYRDPDGSEHRRWWDGERFTEHREG